MSLPDHPTMSAAIQQFMSTLLPSNLPSLDVFIVDDNALSHFQSHCWDDGIMSLTSSSVSSRWDSNCSDCFHERTGHRSSPPKMPNRRPSSFKKDDEYPE